MRSKCIACILAAAIPLLVLVATGGGHVLDPSESLWLSRGDSAQHLVAWNFFSREPWLWPVSEIRSWPAPLGTTIGLSDAIPIVAIPLKALAGSRAANLQYFGLWAAFCLASLAGVSTLFLIQAGTANYLAILGGGLAALSPPVWDRLSRGHPSLAAHALLVGVFVAWIHHFRSEKATRPSVASGCIVVASAAIHPYLLAMTGALMILMIMLGIAHRGLRASMPSVIVAGCASGLALAAAWMSGFFGISMRSLVAGGFGGFEADLLSPLNAADVGRYFPRLFDAGRHREGFAYLGAGTIVVGLIAICAELAKLLRQHPRVGAGSSEGRIPGLRELACACGALALIAMVPRVSVAGLTLVDLSDSISSAAPFFHMFRANGRFIWPLQLLLTLAVISIVTRTSVRPPFAAALLVSGLITQIADFPTWPWGPSRSDAAPMTASTRLDEFLSSTSGVQQLSLVPAYLQSGAGVHCGDSRGPDAWVGPALIAARRGWRFNSGYVARIEASAAISACRDSTVDGILAEPHADELYLASFRQSRKLESSGGFDCERVSRDIRLCRYGKN